jgi:cysteinyl-tRNA synthetase
MSHALLGASFDIHGGGNDLMFPHHENELAQSSCAHPEGGFARIWMHNEMLQVEGKKMSKSLGNFFTVRDLLDRGIPGEVIRFVFLSTHYRKPMDWTDEKARQAEATLRKWRALTEGVEPSKELDDLFLYHLVDDLNTPGAIAQLHRLAADVSYNQSDLRRLVSSARVLGLLTDELADWFDKGPASNNLNVIIDRLISERDQARAIKDFARADHIRDGLAEAGVVVKDTPHGAEWEVSGAFDPAKLEALK